MPLPMPPKNKKDFSWGRFSKTLSFWILILLVPVALIQLSTARAEQAPEIPYTRYREELGRDNIQKVTIQAGRLVRGDFKDRIAVNGRDVKKFTSRLPMENSEEEVKALRDKRVQIQAEDARPSITAWILNFLPWLLLIGFYLFLFKQRIGSFDRSVIDVAKHASCRCKLECKQCGNKPGTIVGHVRRDPHLVSNRSWRSRGGGATIATGLR